MAEVSASGCLKSISDHNSDKSRTVGILSFISKNLMVSDESDDVPNSEPEFRTKAIANELSDSEDVPVVKKKPVKRATKPKPTKPRPKPTKAKNKRRLSFNSDEEVDLNYKKTRKRRISTSETESDVEISQKIEMSGTETEDEIMSKIPPIEAPKSIKAVDLETSGSETE